MSSEPQPDSPIEGYLDSLVADGRNSDPRQLRYLLAETEAHLRDAAAAAQATGLSPHAAEETAVARFGPSAELCRADRYRSQPSYRQLLGQSVWSVVLLGGIGATAVGLSGIIAAALRAFGGDRLVARVAPGQVLASADCARWLAADPRAASCRSAAVADWAAEAVYYRIALGVLGLIGLAVLAWAWRRQDAMGHRPSLLPALFLDTTAFLLFSLAGAWTLAAGVDAVVVAGGDGSGQWFSAAPVALAAAGVFGWRVLGELRRSTGSVGPAGEPAVVA